MNDQDRWAHTHEHNVSKLQGGASIVQQTATNQGAVSAWPAQLQVLLGLSCLLSSSYKTPWQLVTACKQTGHHSP